MIFTCNSTHHLVEIDDAGARLSALQNRGNPTVCDLDIRGHVVVCTELVANPGQSITNNAEHLATKVCQRFQIPLDQLIWIEHYAAQSYKGMKEFDEEFDLVTFDIVGTHFENPQWRPLTLEEREHYLQAAA